MRAGGGTAIPVSARREKRRKGRWKRQREALVIVTPSLELIFTPDQIEIAKDSPCGHPTSLEVVATDKDDKNGRA